MQNVMELILDSLFDNGAYLFNYINLNAFVALLSATLILLIIALFFIFRKKRKGYKTASTLLKMAMLLGLLIPLFL